MILKAITWLEKQGEQKPYGQREECLDCQVNYAGECKGSCELKRNEQKPSWSEEDEDILNTIINHFEIDLECTKNDDIIRWLKSLKNRALPQNTWKPSEEQIRMIEKVVNGQVLFDNQYESLKELLEQLKAL